jgi:hypothetical protein
MYYSIGAHDYLHGYLSDGIRVTFYTVHGFLSAQVTGPLVDVKDILRMGISL